MKACIVECDDSDVRLNEYCLSECIGRCLSEPKLEPLKGQLKVYKAGSVRDAL